MSFEKVPYRVIVGVMLFLNVCFNYTLRVNLSVNLEAMVPLTNQTYSGSQYTLEWTVFERAKVLSSFYWGYLAGVILSLFAAEHLNPKISLITTSLVDSFLTMMSPAAAKESYVYLVVIRVVMGLFSSATFVMTNVLIAKWAVETERNVFASIPIGGSIGTFVAWTICGLVIDRFGWELGFYVFGIACLLTTALLYICVFNTPEQHPRITERELMYITDGRKCSTNFKKKVVPYIQILTSFPCWSLFIMDFGSGWGIYFIITAAPHYISSALGYNTSSTSYLSALTYLVRCFAAFAFAYIGDFILKRKLMSRNILRKCACFIAFVLPGVAIFCMSLQGYSPNFYIICIVLSMGFSGCASVACAATKYDLTNNFIGTLSSGCAILTTLAGNVTPFVTATFIQNDEANPENWRPVFYVGATVYILTGLQFIIFGSTERQHWDHIKDQEGQEESVDIRQINSDTANNIVQ